MRVLINEKIVEYNEHRPAGEPEMTQRRLAALIGVTEGAVSLWINSKRSVPMPTALQIAELLGCELGDLFAPDALQAVNHVGHSAA
ncbi:MAG: helix-turn-helix transcriptional regulator [Armatimonadetes bacterium]|nr:helix-turn-helix transcriptional regulator [Armatimonadota bacterium]